MQMTALCWDACVYKLVCSVPRGIFLSSITLNDKTDTGPRSVITDPHTASVSVFSQCLSYSYVPDLKLFLSLISHFLCVAFFPYPSASFSSLHSYIFRLFRSIPVFVFCLTFLSGPHPESTYLTGQLHTHAQTLSRSPAVPGSVSCVTCFLLRVLKTHSTSMYSYSKRSSEKSCSDYGARLYFFFFSLSWMSHTARRLLWTCLVLKVLNGVLLQAAMWDFFLLWKFYESLSKRVDVFLFIFIHKPTRLSNLQNSEYY